MLLLPFLTPLQFLPFVYSATGPSGPIDLPANELKRLFHSRTQLSLMEGDVPGARGFKEEPDTTTAAYPNYVNRLKEIYDSERLTEESYACKLYKTVDEARDALNEWTDGHRESHGDNRKDWLQRKALLEMYPKRFTQKQYYGRDPYGMDLAKKVMKKHGEGQTIIVLDRFDSRMPGRLLERCANPERFLRGTLGKEEPSSHGVSVASVAVDPEFGAAPMARFIAKTLPDIFPKYKGPDQIPFMHEYVQANVKSLDHGVLAQIDRLLESSEDGMGIEFAASGNFYEIQIPDLTEFNGAIVNMSVQYMDSIGEMRNTGTELYMVRLISFASLLLQMIRRGALIVWASGNNSLVLEHTKAYAVFKSLTIYRPYSFVSVMALEEDATSIAPLSNQPGNHPLNMYTIAAPGSNVRMLDADGRVVRLSGTSASAPFISGIVALLKSNLPRANNAMILKALLKTASPLVIRYSQSRMQNVPVVLSGIESHLLVPSKIYYYKGKDGKDKEIFVTQEMIMQGRTKYGVGRVNVFRAYLHLYNQLKPATILNVNK